MSCECRIADRADGLDPDRVATDVDQVAIARRPDRRAGVPGRRGRLEPGRRQAADVVTGSFTSTFQVVGFVAAARASSYEHGRVGLDHDGRRQGGRIRRHGDRRPDRSTGTPVPAGPSTVNQPPDRRSSRGRGRSAPVTRAGASGGRDGGGSMVGAGDALVGAGGVGVGVGVGVGAGVADGAAVGALDGCGARAAGTGRRAALGLGDGSGVDGRTRATRMPPLRSCSSSVWPRGSTRADALEGRQEGRLLRHDVFGAGEPGRGQRTDRDDLPVRGVRTLERVAAGRTRRSWRGGRRP